MSDKFSKLSDAADKAQNAVDKVQKVKSVVDTVKSGSAAGIAAAAVASTGVADKLGDVSGVTSTGAAKEAAKDAAKNKTKSSAQDAIADMEITSKATQIKSEAEVVKDFVSGQDAKQKLMDDMEVDYSSKQIKSEDEVASDYLAKSDTPAAPQADAASVASAASPSAEAPQPPAAPATATPNPAAAPGAPAAAPSAAATPQPAPMAIGSLNKLVIEEDRIEIHFQIDLDTHSNRNDTVTLSQDNAVYEFTIAMSSLKEFEEDWVKLEFINAPKSGTYTLVQDPNDEDFEPFTIFKEVPYEELVNLTADFDELEVEPEAEEEGGNTEGAQDSNAAATSSEAQGLA